MAATCTYTVGGRRFKIHSWAWRSHTDGTVAAVGTSSGPISGTIRQVEFVPSVTSGSQPTSGYTAKLLDTYGFDWLFGVGSASCPSSGSAAMVKTPLNNTQPPVLTGKTLVPSISTAGDTKDGTIKLTVEEFPIDR